MKKPTAEELAVLRERAERTFSRFPVLPRREDGRMSPESRLRFELTMETILEKNRALGACVVLRRPSGAHETFCFGTARLLGRVPVTEETCFRVASVSKLVMTFGALALVERGALGLDDDLSACLGYPVRNPRFPDAPVTLRMLLTHTASIRDERNYGSRGKGVSARDNHIIKGMKALHLLAALAWAGGMQKGCTLRELLENADNWLPAKPGEAFHYTNLGAGVAGAAMERAANRPFDDIMQELVFAPLAIRASYVPGRIAPRSDLANGYSMRFPVPIRKYNAQALSRRKPDPFDPERDYLCAAGRLITDSAGMAALLGLLASHGEMGVLSRASLDLMRAPQDGLGGVGAVGRGLNVAYLPGVFPGFSLVGHQGVAYGMCAELFADPATGAGVGIMTNGVSLERSTPPLMRVGFDLLSLGFAALRNA